MVASAIAVGFLAVPLFMRISRQYIDLCAAILLLEAGVGFGVLFCTLRAICADHPFTPSINFIYGAPPMAPLLFPNLMVLGIIGLWQLRTSIV